MKALKDYIIPFVGLKEGVHDYQFEADKQFFESYEYSEVKQGKVHVNVSMEKQNRMLIFNIQLKGIVIIPCDRCLNDMEYPVESEERLIVKFGHEWKEETEEILIIPETESQFDISGFIYEYIMLTLPFKRVHPDGDESCINEFIIETGDEGETEIDPRWEALKELKNKID